MNVYLACDVICIKQHYSIMNLVNIMTSLVFNTSIEQFHGYYYVGGMEQIKTHFNFID